MLPDSTLSIYEVELARTRGRAMSEHVIQPCETEIVRNGERLSDLLNVSYASCRLGEELWDVGW